MEGAGRYKKRDKQDIFLKKKNHKCEEGVRFTGRQTENEKKKKKFILRSHMVSTRTLHLKRITSHKYTSAIK